MKEDTISRREIVIKSQFAGGIAGCVAKTIVAPLDRVKLLFQTGNPAYTRYTSSLGGCFQAMSSIYSKYGLRGLYQGHSATLIRIYPYAAIKFVAYEQYRANLIRNPQQETALRRFATGSLAGLTSVAFTYPLELVRVRLAYEDRQIYADRHSPLTLRRIIYQIALEGGKPTFLNFYKGFSATLLGMLPYAGTSFMMHDIFTDYFRKITATAQGPLPAFAQLIAGALAGLFGQTISYPFEVIRRHLQVSAKSQKSIAKVVIEILQKQGFRGFFVGLEIGYLKIVPMTSVSFFIYTRLKYILNI